MGVHPLGVKSQIGEMLVWVKAECFICTQGYFTVFDLPPNYFLTDVVY